MTTIIAPAITFLIFALAAIVALGIIAMLCIALKESGQWLWVRVRRVFNRKGD